MLKKKQTPTKIEKDWFSFSIPLSTIASHDYIALRLLYYIEPATTAFAILSKMLDVAEKSLKLFVTVMEKSPTALSAAREDYGHNIQKLCAQAAIHNKAFNDPDVLAFSADLNDKSGKLYQFIRYGSETTSEEYSAKPRLILPVIDKIFFESLIGLPAHNRRLFVLSSPIALLVNASPADQTRNPALVIEALRHSNAYFDLFSKIASEFDAEYKKMIDPSVATSRQA